MQATSLECIYNHEAVSFSLPSNRFASSKLGFKYSSTAGKPLGDTIYAFCGKDTYAWLINEEAAVTRAVDDVIQIGRRIWGLASC
jgi:hypothetical protein